MPVRPAVWGLPLALSLTDTVPLRGPVPFGVKVTLMLQFPLTASVAGEMGQLLVCAKSPALLPVMLMPLMVNAALPLLDRVTVCAPLVVFTS